MSTLQNLLGTTFPLIQAPLAGVQGSRLALAVIEAGALGSIPAAMLSPEGLRDELSVLQGLPYNVNFFCHAPPTPDADREQAWQDALAPYYEEFGVDPAAIVTGAGRAPFTSQTLELIAAFRPPVVSFHFGLPAPDLMAELRRWGTKILASATTVAEALWLESRGVDAIIAQGLEAGGHRGMFLSDDLTAQLGTFSLVPQVVRAVKLPVIAAGGIADAQGVAAAMGLGAAGVQVGTSYMLCPEAFTSPPHRAALASEAARHTALTNLITGRPARGIVNRLLRELGPMSHLPPAFPLATAAIAPLRSRAEQLGSGDFSPLWSGENATGCKPIPAAELTRELVQGFRPAGH